MAASHLGLSVKDRNGPADGHQADCLETDHFCDSRKSVSKVVYLVTGPDQPV
jgi:hypothetical protein